MVIFMRVVDMGGREVSIELCGGAHVPSTGDIGAFSIVASFGSGRAPTQCCGRHRGKKASGGGIGGNASHCDGISGSAGAAR